MRPISLAASPITALPEASPPDSAPAVPHSEHQAGSDAGTAISEPAAPTAPAKIRRYQGGHIKLVSFLHVHLAREGRRPDHTKRSQKAAEKAAAWYEQGAEVRGQANGIIRAREAARRVQPHAGQSEPTSSAASAAARLSPKTWETFQSATVIEPLLTRPERPWIPDLPLQPHPLVLSTDRDIDSLCESLQSSMSPFHVIQNMDQTGKNEAMFSYGVDRDNEYRWKRLYRSRKYSVGFDHKIKSLGLAANTDTRTETSYSFPFPATRGMPLRSEKLPNKFRWGDQNNGAIRSMEGNPGRPHGISTPAAIKSYETGAPHILKLALQQYRTAAWSQGRSGVSLVVWTPYTRVVALRKNAYSHLGYGTHYHEIDKPDHVDALISLKCRFRILSEEEDGISEQIKLKQFDEEACGRIINAYLDDGSSWEMVWNAYRHDHAFVLRTTPNGIPMPDVTEGNFWTGRPSDFLRLMESRSSLEFCSLTIVDPAHNAQLASRLLGKSAESVHGDLLNRARQMTVSAATLDTFEGFALVLAGMRATCKWAAYDIEHTDNLHMLADALDRSNGNILIECGESPREDVETDEDEDEKDYSGRKMIYTFASPANQHGADKRGIPANPLDDEFAGTPGELLKHVRNNNGVRQVHLICTEPLAGTGAIPAQSAGILRDGLRSLASAGLPIDADDRETQAGFAGFLVKNYGAIPAEITGTMYLRYVLTENERLAGDDRISVRLWMLDRGPLQIDPDAPGTLIRYRCGTGELRSLVLFQDPDGGRYFLDEAGRKRAPDELDRVSSEAGWTDNGIVEILHFVGRRVTFCHDSPLAPSSAGQSGSRSVKREREGDADSANADDLDNPGNAPKRLRKDS